MAMRSIVIGAGIIGTCTALRLAQSGAQVTLLEAGLPGDGTSNTSFAWLNAGAKKGEYFDLNVAGIEAHRRLVAEFSDAPWYVQTGNLEWRDTPEAQERLLQQIKRLEGWNYPAKLLTPAQVIKDLEPDLIIDPSIEAVAYYPEESHIYPKLLLTHLLRAAQSLGVELCPWTKVADFKTSGDRVSGVVLESGEHLDADVVVSCAGPWTKDLLSLVEVNIPLVSPEEPESEAIGLLVLTTQVCASIQRVIHAPGVNIRPDGPSRLLLHSGKLDRLISLETTLSPPPPVAEQVLKRAKKYVRNMETVRVESAIRAIRALPEDEFSVIGWAPGLEGLYVIVTHAGMTLAPALAEMATKEIHGSTEQLLATFRPDRYLQQDQEAAG
jgi:glycine/D-amino acid oxidase-like deaminating enzyme